MMRRRWRRLKRTESRGVGFVAQTAWSLLQSKHSISKNVEPCAEQLPKAFPWREACSSELREPSRNAAVTEDLLQIRAARGCPDLKDVSSESCIS